MSNNDIDLTWDASEFIASCVKFRTKFEASVLILCQIAAMKMEEYAKNEAPWTDRTGNARRTARRPGQIAASRNRSSADRCRGLADVR